MIVYKQNGQSIFHSRLLHQLKYIIFKMLLTHNSFLFALWILSAILYLPISASIKQEIPDLNIPIGIEENNQQQYGYRPKTQRDKQLQALMKIQKKVRSQAIQAIRPITQQEKKLQKMMKIQAKAQMPVNTTASAPSTSTSSIATTSQARVRAKTKPQHPSYS